MLRILLSLALAAVAFFGTLFVDGPDVSSVRAAVAGSVIDGQAYAGATVRCFAEGVFSWTGGCAPAGGAYGMMLTATVGLGVASALLNVIGLLPILGRLTSAVAILAGASGVVTAVWTGARVMGLVNATIGDLGWGAWGMLGFGILLVIVGLNGLGGDKKD